MQVYSACRYRLLYDAFGAAYRSGSVPREGPSVQRGTDNTRCSSGVALESPAGALSASRGSARGRGFCWGVCFSTVTLLMGVAAAEIDAAAPAAGIRATPITARLAAQSSPHSAVSKEVLIYEFPDVPDGAEPNGPVVADADGDLYGSTLFGGSTSCNFDCGLIFKLVKGPAGYIEDVLHSFTGNPDGSAPIGNLILDRSGALYGVTGGGGNREPGFAGAGTVYKLTPSTSGYGETILYTFTAGADGAGPVGGLVADSRGALFGTTLYGGDTLCQNGCGTVFQLIPHGSTYRERVIHRFTYNGIDGIFPEAALIIDNKGNLFGTTAYGGSGTRDTGGDGPQKSCGVGCGTVFELSPTRHGYAERIIYNFQGGADGRAPLAPLVLDAQGGLYGTASSNGSDSKVCDLLCGTVFRLRPLGAQYSMTVLHQFVGGTDGNYPLAGLVMGSKGHLFGTTSRGGGGCNFGNSCGAVFALTPSAAGYTESILHAFRGAADGAEPEASLIIDHGALYGTTTSGGTQCNCGAVFKILRPEGPSRAEW